MALLAEELVEEYLRRNGYFTIRGIHIGVHEIDLLAIRMLNGFAECKHIEVQVSINPISYISIIPKSIRKETGLSPNSAKERSDELLKTCVKDWVSKKYYLAKKQLIRQSLYAGDWKFELVVNKVKHPKELDFISDLGVKVIQLSSIIKDLQEPKHLIINGAYGSSLVDLVNLEQEM